MVPLKGATLTEAVTLASERGYLWRWASELGHLRLKKIRAHHLLSHVLKTVTKESYSARSVNLFLIVEPRTLPFLSGEMKEAKNRRFEIPSSSVGFSSHTSL